MRHDAFIYLSTFFLQFHCIFTYQKNAKMKTVIVNIEKKDEVFFRELFKKFRIKARVLSDEEKEEMALAEWIDEGMKSEDVPLEKVLKHLRKHGVKC